MTPACTLSPEPTPVQAAEFEREADTMPAAAARVESLEARLRDLRQLHAREAALAQELASEAAAAARGPQGLGARQGAQGEQGGTMWERDLDAVQVRAPA